MLANQEFSNFNLRLFLCEFTGITCQNFSNCGCFYTQNTCNSLAASGEDGFLNDLGAVAAGVCTDGADPAEAQPAERS